MTCISGAKLPMQAVYFDLGDILQGPMIDIVNPMGRSTATQSLHRRPLMLTARTPTILSISRSRNRRARHDGGRTLGCDSEAQDTQ